MSYIVPTGVRTADYGLATTALFGVRDSFFKFPGGPLAGKNVTALPDGALTELQSDIEVNYAALSDASGLLTSQQQLLKQASSQPIYGPDPGSNWLIWALLAGLVALYFVFSK